MANDLAIRQQNLAAILDGRAKDLKSILPKGVTVEAFTRLAKNAIIRDPKIAEADPQSVFLEVSKAAQDGLVLDGREAVLTRFSTKSGDKWVTKVTYIPMIAGIKKRVMNSRAIKSWNIGLVYENEIAGLNGGGFEYLAGDEPRIYHKPIIVGERGKVVAAYSSARLPDGTYHHEVMTIQQLLAIKNRTKSRKQDGSITGPWATDEDEMFRKTVARRHAKSLPMSAEDMDVIRRVDDLYDMDEEEYAAPPAPEPEAVANKRKGGVAEKLKRAPAQETAAPTEEETPHTIDGEIIDEDAATDDVGNSDAKDPDDPF